MNNLICRQVKILLPNESAAKSANNGDTNIDVGNKSAQNLETVGTKSAKNLETIVNLDNKSAVKSANAGETKIEMGIKFAKDLETIIDIGTKPAAKSAKIGEKILKNPKISQNSESAGLDAVALRLSQFHHPSSDKSRNTKTTKFSILHNARGHKIIYKSV